VNVTLITAVTLVAKCVAALLALFVASAKFVDWRRHKAVPLGVNLRSAGPVWALDHLAVRQAPMMSGKVNERVAKLPEVASLIQTGDVLTFSGRAVFSYIIRIATYSDCSHCGLAYRDDEGLWVIDSCEGKGVTKRLLASEVKQYPGQWRWARIRHELQHSYDREAAGREALKHVGKTKYGWGGIGLQSLIHLPILRELAYFLRLDQFVKQSLKPFCSMFLNALLRAGDGPAFSCADWLVVPRDFAVSPSLEPHVALLPA